MLTHEDQSQNKVTKFFDGYADDFHKIYGRQQASTLGHWVDRLTRYGMFARFEEMVRQCQAISAVSLLDVGCGPGTHDVYLAEKLGLSICGIDVAPRMIEIARENANARGVLSLCEYIVSDFMKFEAGKDFDVSIALGVVEYIPDPVAFITKMMAHSRKRVMFSLPVKWHWLTPQRVVRYKLRNCPLVFYSTDDIADLVKRCGANSYEVKRMSRDYLVVINTAPV